MHERIAALEAENKIHNETIVREPFVIVTLTDEKGRSATAISKCSPQDTFNEVKGTQVARGRAEASYYQKSRGKKPYHNFMG